MARIQVSQSSEQLERAISSRTVFFASGGICIRNARSVQLAKFGENISGCALLLVRLRRTVAFLSRSERIRSSLLIIIVIRAIIIFVTRICGGVVYKRIVFFAIFILCARCSTCFESLTGIGGRGEESKFSSEAFVAGSS